MEKTQLFTIKGLHCTACTKLTAKRIKGIEGVEDVTVELDTGAAHIVADRHISLAEVQAILAGSEYTAEEYRA